MYEEDEGVTVSRLCIREADVFDTVTLDNGGAAKHAGYREAPDGLP